MWRGVPSHVNGSFWHDSGGIPDNQLALPFRNLFHDKFYVDLISFRLASGYNTMLHKRRKRERDRRERARENQLAHTGARDLLPVRAFSDTHRERQYIPKKRSESFAARSQAWAQARVMGRELRGPTGAGPAETGGQRRAGPSRGQTCSCGCRCGDQAGNYRGRFYVRRSSDSWYWVETATGSGCCHSCWGPMSPL